MIRALFVDDDANVLGGLRRMLHAARPDWKVAFACNSDEALAILETFRVDAVVADMRMSGMDGAQLLWHVRQRHPHTVRIILSGQSDDRTVLRAVRSAHLYLAKPCRADMLCGVIERFHRLGELLPRAALRERVAGINALPSLPAAHMRLLNAVRAADTPFQEIEGGVAGDVGMAAKCLHLVNSSFFGVRGPVITVRQAVEQLGVGTLRLLATNEEVFTSFDPATVSSVEMDLLTRHSVATRHLARELAVNSSLSAMADEVGMAGLLHDVGRIVLSVCWPEESAAAHQICRRDGIPRWEAERAVLGTSHAELGAYLLGLWGFSDRTINAVAWHHRPAEAPSECRHMVAAIHAADALQSECLNHDPLETQPLLDVSYLEQSSLSPDLTLWCALARAHHGGEDGL